MSAIQTISDKAETEATVNAAVEGALNEKLHERHKTIGERIFNRGVYTGIGFGANEVGSLIFTGIFERGNNKYLGRKNFERGSIFLAEKIVTPIKGIFNRSAMTHEGGKKLLMWISLNAVGCLVVPAIKIMDAYKIGIVTKLNHIFDSGGKTEAEIAARDKDVEQAVACEPVQSWKTLIYGRLAAMVAAIGLGYGILQEEGNKKLESAFNNGATAVANKIGLGKYTKGDPKLPAHERSRFHYYSGLAGPETLGCTTSSIVLEAASKYFARKWPSFKNAKIRAEVMEKEKKALASALAEKPAVDSTFAASIGPRKAPEKPAEAYTEKLAAQPETQPQAAL